MPKTRPAKKREPAEVKAPVICPICGATFKDKRGLNGHTWGKHGQKFGLNATLDGLTRELEGVKVSVASLAEAINQRYVDGQRCLDLAERVLQLYREGRCNGAFTTGQLQTEIERLKGGQRAK